MSPELRVALTLAIPTWMLLACVCLIIETKLRTFLPVRGDIQDGFPTLVGIILFWPVVMPLRIVNRAIGFRQRYDDVKSQLTRAEKMSNRSHQIYQTETREYEQSIQTLQDVLAEIEPYVNWREITDDLDGKTCEDWSDALDSAHSRWDRRDGVYDTPAAYSPTDRWWRPEELK